MTAQDKINKLTKLLKKKLRPYVMSQPLDTATIENIKDTITKAITPRFKVEIPEHKPEEIARNEINVNITITPPFSVVDWEDIWPEIKDEFIERLCDPECDPSKFSDDDRAIFERVLREELQTHE